MSIEINASKNGGVTFMQKLLRRDFCFAGEIMTASATDAAADDLLGMSASSFGELSEQQQASLLERLSLQKLHASCFREPGLSPSGTCNLGRIELLGACK